MLADELARQKHSVSHTTVGTLLEQAGFSLQANRKMREGRRHPDRNAQGSEYINGRVKSFLGSGTTTSDFLVGIKKKELVGYFKNGGRECRPTCRPEEARVHDFADKELGKAIPYSVYDLKNNEGWLGVGIDYDTAEFAAAAIRRWWREMGHERFSACGGVADHRRRRG